MCMWTHAVLEIYQQLPEFSADLESWPEFGEPADWISEGLVGYCQGSLEDVVILTPLWRLLWWKLKGVLYL